MNKKDRLGRHMASRDREESDTKYGSGKTEDTGKAEGIGKTEGTRESAGYTASSDTESKSDFTLRPNETQKLHKDDRQGFPTRAGKKVVSFLDGIVNYVVLAVFLLLAAYGCYALWDAHTIYGAADSSNYETYKPTKKNMISFDKLRAINPDVLGWISVYKTHIDYPLVQAKDNEKYLNMDAKGGYSLSGSIFLDYRSDPHFTDFNTIIYGHHMDKKKMFGELGYFKDKKFFDAHKYGSIFYDGKEHGLTFFAFMEVDAYDGDVYHPGITDPAASQHYLDLIGAKAVNKRQLLVTPNDHLVLLSTCTADITNGRQLLVGKITDQPEKAPKKDKSKDFDADEM